MVGSLGASEQNIRGKVFWKAQDDWDKSRLAHTLAGWPSASTRTCAPIRVCNMLDLEAITPGAFSLLFDLNILSPSPSSLLLPSWLFTLCQTPLSHPIHHQGPGSHSGSLSHLPPRVPPRCCTPHPLLSLQHILSLRQPL